MSDSCTRCVVAGKTAGAICKAVTNAGGLVGKGASFVVCGGVGAGVQAACERISHCSVTKSAEWKNSYKELNI